MFECPLPGDSINLCVFEDGTPDPDKFVRGVYEQHFKVGKRKWVPDCVPSPIDGKRIAVLVLLERT